MRGATAERMIFCAWQIFQSTHPVRGATQDWGWGSADLTISIHAPREGCDKDALAKREQEARFQSTHPVRGATGSPFPLEQQR